MNKQAKIIALGLLSFTALGYGGYLAVKWGVMRTYVGHDEILVVTNRFGDNLPSDRRTVKEGEGFKGVRDEVFGPGRYFFDPLQYETVIARQTVVGAGNPSKWEWDALGNLKDPASAPQVGLLTLLEGPTPASGDEVVDPGFKGIQRAVLTPGVYKINPVKFKVDLVPAVVVPPGSVGVVTRLVGDVAAGEGASVVETQSIATEKARAGVATTRAGVGSIGAGSTMAMPFVVGAKQRGILRDVLQPGVYYLNPRMVKVSIVPVGYDAITTRNTGAAGAGGAGNDAIRFYTNDGYLVEADFTVVWGRRPADAPELVRNIGDIDRVAEIVIEPAMKAAAQNEGGRYSAKELIQGKTRTKFQEELSASLERQVQPRNIEVLLALIRNITIKDASTGRDATQGLLSTIQQANIEVERELTNRQKTQTAVTRAGYEEALKAVDIAKEEVVSESQQKVANLLADGAKKAAQIAAQTEVEVARIQAEVAGLEAQRTEILGKAAADVLRLKNEAEAKGAKMLVDALGGPAAYNQYTFAKNFDPKDLRLIFAGPGTFWTDLKSFQEVGGAQAMQAATRPSR